MKLRSNRSGSPVHSQNTGVFLRFRGLRPVSGVSPPTECFLRTQAKDLGLREPRSRPNLAKRSIPIPDLTMNKPFRCRFLSLSVGLLLSSPGAALAQAPDVAIDPITDAVGSDFMLTGPELRASVTFSGTTTDVADGTQVVVSLAGTQIGTPSVASSAWSLTVDDGLSGVSGAVDISGLSDEFTSLVVEVTTAGGTDQASAPFVLYKTPSLEFSGAEYPSEDNPGQMKIIGGGLGFGDGQSLNYVITDEAAGEITGTTQLQFFGEGFGWEILEDPTSLVDGLITVVISGTDSIGNYAEVTAGFTLDRMASGSIELYGPRSYWSREFATSNYYFDGLTEGVEPGQRVDLTLSGTSGIDVRAEAYLDEDGEWRIFGNQFRQVGKKNEFYSTAEFSYGRKSLDICVLKNVADVGLYPYRGDFLTVFQSEGTGGGQDVFYQKITEDGVAVGSPVEITSTNSGDDRMPVVGALDDGGWVIAWEDGNAAVWQRFDKDGNSQSAATQVDGASTLNPAVAGLRDGGFVIVYAKSSALWYKRYDASGVNTATVQVWGSSAYSEADVAALSAGGWVIAFASSGGFSDGGDNEVACVGYDSSGAVLGAGVQMCNAPDSASDTWPRVASTGGGWVVTWFSNGNNTLDGGDGDILAQRYSASGAALGGNILVDVADTAMNDRGPVVSWCHSGWVVVWATKPEDGGNLRTGSSEVAELRYSRFDNDGNVIFRNAYLNEITLEDLATVFPVSMATHGTGRWMHLINQASFGADFCLSWLGDVYSTSDDVYLLGDGIITAEARVQDQADNVAVASTSVEGEFSRPEIIGMTISDTAVEGGEPIVLTLTFDEPVQQVRAGHIVTDSSTVTLSGNNISSELLTNHQVTIYAQPVDQDAGGTFRPYLLNNVNISDAYGNAVKNGDVLGDEITVSKDLTAPRLLSFEPSGSVTTGENHFFRLVFSEPVQGVNSGDFSFDNVTGDPAEIGLSVSASGSDEITGGNLFIDFDFLAGVGGTSGAFTLDLDASLAGITDFAGNALVEDFASASIPVSASAYQAWAIGHGLTAWGLTLDSDLDQLSDVQEFYHNMDPTDSKDSMIQRVSTVDVDGKRYLCLTIPFRDEVDADFQNTGSNTSTGPARFAGEIQGFFFFTSFESSLDLGSFNSPVGFTILDTPQDGPIAGLPDLPTLPTGYHYRSIRLNVSTEDQPKAFMRLNLQAVQD